MRPAIDISYGTHGRVRDLAEYEGIDVSEAYERVLKVGLEELENNCD